MDNDLNTRIFCPDIVDVLGQESLVNRAVSLPENYLRVLQPIKCETAIDQVRIPDTISFNGIPRACPVLRPRC